MRSDHDYKLDLLQAIRDSGDFTGSEKIEQYIKEYDNEKDPAQKSLILFLIYRLSAGLKERNIKNFDADVCRGVVENYRTNFSYYNKFTVRQQGVESPNNPKYELVYQAEVYRGDSMTSIWTSLKEYTKLYLGVNSIALDDEWEHYIFRNRSKLHISKNFGKFLSLGHSVGNFNPVPLNFNTSRSHFGKRDYWDLTLIQIREWYTDQSRNQSDEALAILLGQEILPGKINETINYTKQWLKSFNSWDQFVSAHYFEPFVENGKVIPFYPGHNFYKSVQKTLEDFETLFLNCSTMIEKRGRLILKETPTIKADEPKNKDKILTEDVNDSVVSKGNLKDCLRNSNLYKKIIEGYKDFTSDPVEYGGFVFAIATIIVISLQVIMILIPYFASDSFRSMFTNVFSFKWNSSLSSIYYSSLGYKLSWVLLAISLFIYLFKAVRDSDGFRRMALILSSILFMITTLGIILFDLILRGRLLFLPAKWAEAAFKWFESSGDSVSLILLVPISLFILMIIQIRSVINEAYDELNIPLILILALPIIIPLVLLLISNFVPLVVVAVIAIVLIVIYKLYNGNSEPYVEKHKMFDEDGNHVGYIEK